MMGSWRQARERQKKMVVQRLLGLLMLVVCVAVVCSAIAGVTPEDKDCTALLLLIPITFRLLFSRSVIIY